MLPLIPTERGEWCCTLRCIGLGVFFCVFCSFAYCLMFGLFFFIVFSTHTFAKGLAVEDDECDDSTADASICEVEYRAEEHAMFVGIGQERNVVEPIPSWHIPFDEWKVEHVDHPPFKYVAIAFTPGYESCYVDMSGLGEDFAIEDAVEYVAKCSCSNHRQADDESCLESASGESHDEP